MSRERYGLIGTGSRAGMYIRAITGDHADKAELVAWADPNPGRQDHYDKVFDEAGLPRPHRWDPADLERMIAEERLDRVVVTTPDHLHAEYVARTLLAGADAVVEKPLTIDAEGVRRISDAVAQSGRDVVTTFNYRYSPRNSSLKRLITEGAIGQVTSLQFEWVLDTSHGADYFRRWHRYKDRSGGLFIHKASHHFDLINWWIDAVPTKVYASGGLKFYGADNARARGLGPRPERGTGHAENDPFALDLTRNPTLKALYLDNEHHDGYLRDRDVFDEGITIEDNLSVVVDYDNGAGLSYSLNAHSPWEGYRVVVNGTEGRAELEVIERAAVIVEEDAEGVVDPSAAPADFGADPVRPEGERLVLQRHWQRAEEVEIPAGIGGHGGGDAYLLEHLFTRTTTDEPLHRVAGLADGVAAVSVGIAGNRSLETGQAVEIAELGLRGDGS
ncbi:gfo/Idh/MocA family oxidoreductase [Auraticoccus sp. F435]|uniref:Gfo/Idh/MocA family oxidoreductase n=1 Tax=Auraticoccus cholistanensis TaxID=2656650 RepID=A0A6A9USL7_9ACTN|nr:Gfo/Idh/MocA family oxidoreductase [Auraticoccus cholistanensis]MVA74715.1 gfo/Idh/MocA family oxidoreductase [Auraticoccus cholistanensis]